MAGISPTLQKTLSNITWLSVDRMVRLFGSVVINAWLVRYLGPEQNGIFSYALAFVGMFAPLAVLGMDSVVIRDIVRDPSRKERILGSAFVLRLTGAAAAMFFAIGGIFIVRPHDPLIQLLVGISSLGLIFQAFDVIDYWFQSQVLSKYTVYARNTAFFTLGIAKITALVLNAGLPVFVMLSSLELMTAAFALVVMYAKRGQSVRQWRFDGSIARELMMNSWPIIVSDLAMFAQTRIDQVMIGEMMTNADVGFYAAAQKISEPLGFIPMVIMSSVFPVIVRTRERSREEYLQRLTNVYRLMFMLAVVVCLPFAVFSKHIVYILYGDTFAASANILMFLIWTRFYVFYGVARSIFISSENLFRHALMCSISGVTVNIALNYLLIPRFGVYGSIIAAHAGFVVTIFVIDGLSGSTRKNFRAMIDGILTFYKFRLR